MSDTNVKETVRERDGFQCRDCGMTEAEHLEQYDRDLEVHRVLPGCEYSVTYCVTLCVGCHGRKPRKIVDAIFQGQPKDVIFLALNRYDDVHRHILDALAELGRLQGRDIEDVMISALLDYAGKVPIEYYI